MPDSNIAGFRVVGYRGHVYSDEEEDTYFAPSAGCQVFLLRYVARGASGLPIGKMERVVDSFEIGPQGPRPGAGTGITTPDVSQGNQHANLKLPVQTSEKPSPAEGFARLVEIMARLRAPDGCPWDRDQNFDTIKPYLLEETYEVMDAIDSRDFKGLAEELGDLLLQSVFFAQMASEEGHFDIRDSLEAINNKLVRRHPRVFGDGEAKTPDDVKRTWDAIKKTEKARPQGLLAGVPRTLPALVEAQQIASRAATAGFDWENAGQVFDKLDEEVAELHGASSADDVEDELGDILFVIVNLARFMKVDPEQALRRANRKFRSRFGYVEQQLAANGKAPQDSTIDEMEALWQDAKKNNL